MVGATAFDIAMLVVGNPATGQVLPGRSFGRPTSLRRPYWQLHGRGGPLFRMRSSSEDSRGWAFRSRCKKPCGLVPH